MNKDKFTQEVKDAWVEALESGDYVQGKYQLQSEDCTEFCCIGVLGHIHPKLSNYSSNYKDPYNYLSSTIGCEKTEEIYLTNDYDESISDEPDFSNVLPLIKTLPVQD